jgi:hypothetical protein
MRTRNSDRIHSKEQIMSRKQYSQSKQLTVAMALALGASGVALADDSSMSRFGGDAYGYFNQPARADTAASAGWRQGHPNGLTDRELQAFSASDLSASVAQLNPSVFASAPADPNWRVSHPKGLTERELQALSASSLAVWQFQNRLAPTPSMAQSEPVRVSAGPGLNRSTP